MLAVSCRSCFDSNPRPCLLPHLSFSFGSPQHWESGSFCSDRDSMSVTVKFASLKQTKWHEYAVRFIFGGLTTMATGIIAKKFGPGIGGLFLAFPAIFPASATLMEKHELERKRRAGLHGELRGMDAAGVDAAGAAMGS